jgi:biotin transport system substrate-specific component
MRPDSHPTLAEHLWPAVPSLRIARAIGLAFAGTLALILSAKAQVPFYPVPLTLQTLVVLVLGAAFGARLGAATVALYLAEGIVGLPVFAGATAGPLYMAGPTGGYLVGFCLAAACVGFCAERGYDRSPWRLLAVMTLGHVVIFICGFAWLSVLIGPAKAWIGGVTPFVWETIVKTLLATALVAALWRLAARLRGQ